MMRSFLAATIVASFVAPHVAMACPGGVKGYKNKGSWAAYFNEHKKLNKMTRKPADVGRLPYAGLEPWGGDVVSEWKPEAVMANAASEALNDGFAEAGVADVLVSMPVKMSYSDNRVYDDGQTNAAVDLGDGWKDKEPVLIATLIKYKDGSQKVKFRFHKSLAVKNATLSYGGKTKSFAGDSVFEWKPSASEAPSWGTLFENRVAFIQPTRWESWFPVDFRDVVKPAAELLEQVPADKRKLGRGTLLDPMNVSVQGKSGDAFPFLAMESDKFGLELKGERYFPVPATGEPQGIHNVFNGSRVTSVGRGHSLVFQEPPASLAPFKMVYICFDARNREAEGKFGVPSGGGWHEVGDEAETVLNTLENAPVVFGYANGRPAESPSGKFAYEMSDVAVIRKIMPGSAIVTAAGNTTWDEDTLGEDGKRYCRARRSRSKGEASGRTYHWFIFDHPHNVCAMEWVHPNRPRPDNRLGFAPMERRDCKK